MAPTVANDAHADLELFRLDAVARNPETRLLSRRSGDEFVAWAELDEHQLQELTAAVSRFEVRDHATRIPVSLTMGVARYPHDAANLNDLIFCAEYAHREAKRRARQSFVVFDHQLGARLARSRQIEERISRALQRCDIKPFYQPEVHMVTGQITGFEALARWHDPELGWIAPDEFVPVIEHLRLSSDLTQCILTGILYDAGQIRQRFPGCKIAFNAAPNDFHGNQLLDTIHCILSGSTCIIIKAIPNSSFEVCGCLTADCIHDKLLEWNIEWR
jgi:predicted signal transduction protein with EAL and GGDEF domain